MAKTITVGLQKGGVGKTTTSALISYLMSLNHKVLAIDMDTQGNLSEMFLQANIDELIENGQIKGTILEALTDQDAKPYIIPFSDQLDLIVATDDLAILPQYIYENIPQGERALLLGKTLEPLQDMYDYIIIDTPPSLSEATLNALGASDGVLILFECSLFARSALDKFFDTIAVTRQINPKLKVLGILPTMIESRRLDPKLILEELRSDDLYGQFILPTIVKRKATIGRLPIYGLQNNKELISACESYIAVTRRLVERV